MQQAVGLGSCSGSILDILVSTLTRTTKADYVRRWRGDEYGDDGNGDYDDDDDDDDGGGDD